METITKIRKHVGALERRAAYIAERIESGRLSDAAAAHERRERDAILAGIKALEQVRIIGDVHTSPVMALQELLDAIEESDGRMSARRTAEALAHARVVLTMLDSVA